MSTNSADSVAESLGSPTSILRTARAIATLDLILSPEWEYRYYSYNSRWAPGEQMASMRNGEGDEWFLLFLDNGWCGLKGISHESPAAELDDLVAQIRNVLPRELHEFGMEPAFAWEGTSFCFWFDPSRRQWIDAGRAAGLPAEIDTGAHDLLRIIEGEPTAYQVYAKEYFEADIPLPLVEQFFNLTPLTRELVSALNPQVDINMIADELDEIGYPRS